MKKRSLPANVDLSFEALQATLCRSKEEFPRQKAIYFYLLFLRCMHTADGDELVVEAARLLCGILNLLSSRKGLGAPITAAELQALNTKFFERLGGIESLLYVRPIEQFHDRVMSSCRELQMSCDVLSFRLNAAMVLPRKLSSARMAYKAIAANVFNRTDKYGIRAPDDGKRAKQRQQGEASTAETVRKNFEEYGSKNPYLLLYNLLARFSEPCILAVDPQVSAFWAIAQLGAERG